MKKLIMVTVGASLLMVAGASASAGDIDAQALFTAKCAMCHDLNSKKVGPAVKEMNKDSEVLRQTITNGRKMMPKFMDKMSADEVEAMVKFIQANQ